MPEPRPTTATLRLALGALLVLIVLVRALGSSDFYSSPDQARTASLTADMLDNGRWVLPVDAAGEPSHKPVLTNWLSAACVAAFGPGEFAYKLVSVLSCAVTALALVLLAPRLLGVTTRAGALAALIWLATPSTLKHVYFCRPDMLFTALLTLGWLATTGVLLGRGGRTWTVTAWLCFAAAMLTKGPLALLIPIYAVVGARATGGSWRSRARTGIIWGLPFGLAALGAWLWAAWRIDPGFVSAKLFGEEVGGRASVGLGGVLRVWEIPLWFVERFAPWSLAFVAVLFARDATRGERAHAPLLLWIGLVALAVALIPSRGGSYLMPGYPAAALLVAALADRTRRGPMLVLVLAGATTATVFAWRFAAGPGVANNLGRESRRFVTSAVGVIDPARTVFLETGLSPVPALLGAAPPPVPPRTAWDDATHIIAPASLGDVIHGPGTLYERTDLVMDDDVPDAQRFAIYGRAGATPPDDPERVSPDSRDVLVSPDGRRLRAEIGLDGRLLLAEIDDSGTPVAHTDLTAELGLDPIGAVSAVVTGWRAVMIFVVERPGRLRIVWTSPDAGGWRASRFPKPWRTPVRPTIASFCAPINGLVAIAAADENGRPLIFEWTPERQDEDYRATRIDLPGVASLERARQTGFARVGFIATLDDRRRFWIGKSDAWAEGWRSVEIAGP